jgi:hypothetical protein
MARRVPEPIEKCAVRSASPISTTLPKLHCRFEIAGNWRQKDLLESIGWPSRSLCKHLLAMADRLLLAHVRRNRRGCQVASVTSTRKVLMRRAVAVVMGTEDAMFGVAESQRQAVEDLAGAVPDEAVGCAGRFRCRTSVLVLVAYPGKGAVGGDHQIGPAQPRGIVQRGHGSLSNSILTPSDSAWAYSRLKQFQAPDGGKAVAGDGHAACRCARW